MRILVCYASIEGQTWKIARFAEVHAQSAGHEVTLVDVREKNGGMRLEGIDRVILAASVHRQRHPVEFEKFLTRHGPALTALPTLLISVSLCAAFENGREEASSYVSDLSERTGFVPGDTALVGGALQFDKYKDYESQVVRFIALDLEQYDAVDGDREFTDWAGLDETLTGFLGA